MKQVFLLFCLFLLVSEFLLAQEPPSKSRASKAFEDHAKLLLEDRFPSATACRSCHPQHYREWSVSQHSYALLSPVFTSLHGTILKKTNGTFGDFCIRCHTPVGMTIGEPIFMSAMDRHPTSREGVTCIVCHRVDQSYGKLSGRVGLTQGSLTSPVKGPTGNTGLKQVLENTKDFSVVTEEGEVGRKIHKDAERFFPLTTSGFCASCHDVTFANGFRLEEAFTHYKHSPAAKRGLSCQDCHMGKEPGRESGYAEGPAAIVGGVPTRTRKLTSHLWVGPDHSVIHPGLFPHNPDAQELASMKEWTQFDHQAGWGTDDFEDEVEEDRKFPERWSSIDDRYDAREIIEENMELLDWAQQERLKLLRQGYVLGELEVEQADRNGIRFKVEVRNGTDGHAVPTGFDAERLVWLQVNVIDLSSGETVLQSGDLDPLGDVRDLHSDFVHNGEMPLDTQLFSLQSRFLTRNIRGGEREQVVSVNFSTDPLPFARPATRANSLLGRPLGARKHRKSIEPLGSRWAHYHVNKDELSEGGAYRVTIALKAAMAPANLLRAIVGVGLDFNMTPRQAAKALLAGHLTLWNREFVLNLPKSPGPEEKTQE